MKKRKITYCYLMERKSDGRSLLLLEISGKHGINLPACTIL